MNRAISLSLLHMLVLLIGFAVAEGARAGKAVQVANNGTDSPTCGAKSDPCRTITQAIANAPEGGAVEVGPGIYGDVNQNGALGEAGEEPTGVEMIVVDKPLRITSRAGAGATVLNAGGAAIGSVTINADDVVFGKPKKGFTVTGAAGAGVSLVGLGNTLSGNSIVGNGMMGIFVGNGTGSHRIVGNRITENGSNGILLQDGEVKVVDNVIARNGDDGIAIESNDNTISRNVVTANDSYGIHFDLGVGTALEQNSIIGNRGAGIRLEAGTGATISKSNIFANNLMGASGADGLDNGSGGAISAEKNYWGAATGPGADPADDISGDPVDSDPVASKAFRIRVKVAQ